MGDGDEERHTQYRCSLFPITKLFRDLSTKLDDDHQKLMVKTPFRHLPNAFYEGRVRGLRKRDKSLDQILSTYDKQQKAFKLGNEYCKPTRMELKLMFGIVDGAEVIGDMKFRKDYPSDFGVRLFGMTGKITMCMVKENIFKHVVMKDDRSRADTVKLLCLVLMQSFFLPNTSGNMPRGFLQFVDTFERMSQFDWSTKIYDQLMQGLAENWTACSKVDGCTVFVMYWLCEKSCLLNEASTNRNGTITMGYKAVPRVCKWILTEAEKIIALADLGRPDVVQFSVGELEPTSEEVLTIPGLAELMDEIEAEKMKHELPVEMESELPTKNTNEQPMQEHM